MKETQRVIKFRCWDLEKKRLSLPFEIGQHIIQWTDGDIDMPTGFAQAKDSRFIFQQFCGLQDSKGVDIYDKDVVDDGNGNTGVIVWNQSDCSFCVDFKSELQQLTQCDHPAASFFNDWLTVIGHMYDPKFSHLL
jgi:hypothetical protein